MSISLEDQKRYFVAHLADGSQLTEHQCSWGNIPIHDIIMLELSMLGNKYQLEKRHLPPTFVEFIQFKTAEKHGLAGQDQTVTRSIGWHDGKDEFIITVDEKTGQRIGDVTVLPVRHLHLKSKLLVGG